jgi:stage II sporulation protein D
MLGHGVGMSGRGARGMGAEGKNYKEILKYFYTGTDVSKVDTNRNVRVGIYAIDI